jgi:hypothetical protein
MLMLSYAECMLLRRGLCAMYARSCQIDKAAIDAMDHKLALIGQAAPREEVRRP